MAAPTIFEDVVEDLALDGTGQLFAGKKFWVAQRVPLRNQLLDNITANGGEVVKLEKKADYLIADHFRPRLCPPGSISYTFIEKSIKDGQLHDPQDHVAGPPAGEAREPGAVDRPAKGVRTAYTAEDDNVLYKWVHDCIAQDMLPDGNVMYKDLEKVVSTHMNSTAKNIRLTRSRTHDTPGSHGATATSNGCNTVIRLPLASPPIQPPLCRHHSPS